MSSSSTTSYWNGTASFSSTTPYWTGIFTRDFSHSPIEIFVVNNTYIEDENSTQDNNSQTTPYPHIFDQTIQRLNNINPPLQNGETRAAEAKKEILEQMTMHFRTYLSHALTVVNSSLYWDDSESSLRLTNVPHNHHNVVNGTRIATALEQLTIQDHHLHDQIKDLEAGLFDYMGPNCQSCGAHTLRPRQLCDICWFVEQTWEKLAYILVLGVPGSGTFGPILRQNPPSSLRQSWGQDSI